MFCLCISCLTLTGQRGWDFVLVQIKEFLVNYALFILSTLNNPRCFVPGAMWILCTYHPNKLLYFVSPLPYIVFARETHREVGTPGPGRVPRRGGKCCILILDLCDWLLNPHHIALLLIGLFVKPLSFIN